MTPTKVVADDCPTWGVLAERVAGHWRLDDERWQSHSREHVGLAKALDAYKADANEWRDSMVDLRGTFMTTVEYNAEFRALLARVEIAERLLQTLRDRDMATRDVLSSGRAAILLAASIIGTLIALAIYLRGN